MKRFALTQLSKDTLEKETKYEEKEPKMFSDITTTPEEIESRHTYKASIRAYPTTNERSSPPKDRLTSRSTALRREDLIESRTEREQLCEKLFSTPILSSIPLFGAKDKKTPNPTSTTPEPPKSKLEDKPLFTKGKSSAERAKSDGLFSCNDRTNVENVKGSNQLAGFKGSFFSGANILGHNKPQGFQVVKEENSQGEKEETEVDTNPENMAKMDLIPITDSCYKQILQFPICKIKIEESKKPNGLLAIETSNFNSKMVALVIFRNTAGSILFQGHILPRLTGILPLEVKSHKIKLHLKLLEKIDGKFKSIKCEITFQNENNKVEFKKKINEMLISLAKLTPEKKVKSPTEEKKDQEENEKTELEVDNKIEMNKIESQKITEISETKDDPKAVKTTEEYIKIKDKKKNIFDPINQKSVFETSTAPIVEAAPNIKLLDDNTKVKPLKETLFGKSTNNTNLKPTTTSTFSLSNFGKGGGIFGGVSHETSSSEGLFSESTMFKGGIFSGNQTFAFTAPKTQEEDAGEKEFPDQEDGDDNLYFGKEDEKTVNQESLQVDNNKIITINVPKIKINEGNSKRNGSICIEKTQESTGKDLYLVLFRNAAKSILFQGQIHPRVSKTFLKKKKNYIQLLVTLIETVEGKPKLAKCLIKFNTENDRDNFSTKFLDSIKFLSQEIYIKLMNTNGHFDIL